ncbi:aldolase catalytic domain-containing protein [Synechococcus sp. ROS8604]|uniref:aldolase catalytic domain-containing protein n=1 Tax=Synechococcus sp. ROS8604 TaxID=1442557 RepID=UPI001646E427|nr:aldolase catalytic domain-containing protein [Synechococcus sp. ROS8604]QNI86961.1 HMGL-like family protein [Synechococcus sp. ROS8604]
MTFDSIVHLDCTLRDGGYYNSWQFSESLITDYLVAMKSSNIDIVEIGLRSLSNSCFKGPNAYSSESFLGSLNIPKELKVAVMVNASELVAYDDKISFIDQLFPIDAIDSHVDIVRIASNINHVHGSLSSIEYLASKGYQVCLNVMQISEANPEEVSQCLAQLSDSSLSVLYFADSLGSMNNSDIESIIDVIQSYWPNSIGIHTHDNIGLALSNTLHAIKSGVKWVDSTVTGMGRGAGNARTEELCLELALLRGDQLSILQLMALIENHFYPLKHLYKWGTNVYYYLAGKYSIHPSYIQCMLQDSRFSTPDRFSVINYLQKSSSNSFSVDALQNARQIYTENNVSGQWSPCLVLENKDVLLLATGPGVEAHKDAIRAFITKYSPVVIAYNLQTNIDSSLIDYSIACHPLRLLADLDFHLRSSVPLIAPISALPSYIRDDLKYKTVHDFGISLSSDNSFSFFENRCIVPYSLVLAYSLALTICGKANHVYMAGFDGYSADDPRNHEAETIFDLFSQVSDLDKYTSITPTRYNLNTKSVYGYI